MLRRVARSPPGNAAAGVRGIDGLVANARNEGMKRLSSWLLIGVALLAVAACAKKEITPLQRKQAATLASEADFASTVRDYARAESLLAQAAALTPDTGVYWLGLGSARMNLGKKDDARDAYRRALAAFEDAARDQKAGTEPMMQQVYVLALLGRVDEARRVQDKMLKRFPNDRDSRAFVEEKQLERLLDDPKFKQLAL